MKIKSMKLENHPILNNLELDFTNSESNIIDNIIFAGDNGCGKSTLLNIIYDFSIYAVSNQSSNEKRQFVIKITDYDLEILENNERTKNIIINGIFDNELTFDFDYNYDNWNQINISYKDNEMINKKLHGNIFTTKELRPILKTIFSDVEINFNPGYIQNVTAKNLDQVIESSQRTTGNISSEITQLLIDIQALDDADIAAWTKKHDGEVIDCSSFENRIDRFNDAFNYIFDGLIYKEIQNYQNRKMVIFESPSGEIPIEKLSSGEKQIVFRGSYLLKDKKSINGALILIDEPEISLHPNWQKKITNFYKRLFLDSTGSQSSQIFMATHSPFIIHNDLRHNDKVIVLKRETNGIIRCLNTPEFPGYTESKVVEEAFNINLTFESEKPIVFVEGPTDEKYFKKAAVILENNNLNIEFKSVGTVYPNGIIKDAGSSGLDKVNAHYDRHPELLKQTIILLYDSDEKKTKQDKNHLFIRTIPEQINNTYFEKGIENLLNLPPNFDKNLYCLEKEKPNKDRTFKNTIRELDKTKLCKVICDELKGLEQKDYFKNFASVFDIIKEIIE